MPELPEVEHAARSLRAWMLGRRVIRAAASPTRILRTQSPRLLAMRLSGRILERVERRGKWLLLGFAPPAGLLLHLGMTGKLVRRRLQEREPYSHVRFVLDDGSVVHLVDPRKFGRATCFRSFEEAARAPEIAALGPDARDAPLTAGLLAERLAGLRRPIKVALLDQRLVAGLGNLHAAEALFRARLGPRRLAGRLGHEELSRLSRAIAETIDFGLKTIEPEGVDGDVEYVEEPGAENPYLVYGKAGEPCSRCGARLHSFAQGGRTTFYCPRCQR
jgi:formamidopyrimidine-DNA glycosylase